MTNEAQAVDAEPTVEANTDVEPSQVEEVTPEAEAEEQTPETTEEKNVRLEKDNERATTKIGRQKAAYASQQKAYDAIQRELQELRAGQKPVEPTVEPVMDDFESYELWQDALVEHRVNAKMDVARKEDKTKHASDLKQKAQAERQSLIQKQESTYSQDNPEYKASRDEFVEFSKSVKADPTVESAMIDVAMDAGSFAEVINYFGENGGERLEEFSEIVNLNPVQAGIRIHEIVKGLKGTTKPVSKSKPLPKPITNVKGSSKAKTSIDNLSGDQFLKKMKLK